MAIISFSRGFIFVKTTKTAGTSAEVHLARHCGPEDIITPIFPEVQGHQPRNYEGPEGATFFNHQPLADICTLLDPAFFSSTFKFCFERHPIDKCISHYSMFKNSAFHTNLRFFADWDDYVEQGRFPIDHTRYMDADGRLLVDRVYPYERLQGSLDDVAQRCAFQPEPLTVREKTGWRETIIPTPAQRESIMKAFCISNALMGYT